MEGTGTTGGDDDIVNKLDDFEIDFSEGDTDIEENSGEKREKRRENSFLSETVSVTSNSLLRATICELERALKDTRRLLYERDKENSVLRQELEKARKELHKEQQARKKIELESTSKAEKSRKADDEEAKLREEVKKLKDQLQQFEHLQQNDDPEDIVPCCSSMHELVEVKRKLMESEKELEEFKVNNQPASDQKALAVRQPVGSVALKYHKQAQKEIQTQLRMKFLRDAFFYYMIDFHADEQMKAILAILEYEDRRQDIIVESHKMRRQGKKFTVTEVSSRSFTFVREES